MAVRAIRIGARGSALSRRQTELVIHLLSQAHPGLSIELVPIVTQGDRSQATNTVGPEWGTGVFVKELEAALLDGRVDLAVHSLKDVPPELPPGLALLAIPEREDPGDVLVSPTGLRFEDLPRGAKVGTASARRAAFLRYARPDLRLEPIRGNVDSRYRKLLAGEYDAVVLARAGLSRLEMQVPGQRIDPTVLPPAPGQGALALEGRAADEEIRRLAASLNHPPTAAAVQAERTAMRALGGGCRLPVAALATPVGSGELELLAAVAAPDGSAAMRHIVRGSIDDPEALGEQVARALEAQGVRRLVTWQPANA